MASLDINGISNHRSLSLFLNIGRASITKNIFSDLTGGKAAQQKQLSRTSIAFDYSSGLGAQRDILRIPRYADTLGSGTRGPGKRLSPGVEYTMSFPGPTIGNQSTLVLQRLVPLDVKPSVLLDFTLFSKSFFKNELRCSFSLEYIP